MSHLNKMSTSLGAKISQSLLFLLAKRIKFYLRERRLVVIFPYTKLASCYIYTSAVYIYIYINQTSHSFFDLTASRKEHPKRKAITAGHCPLSIITPPTHNPATDTSPHSQTPPPKTSAATPKPDSKPQRQKPNSAARSPISSAAPSPSAPAVEPSAYP